MSEKIKLNPETEKTNFNTAELGKVGNLASEIRETRIESAREDVKFWARQYENTERSFISKNIKDEKEFKIWENDAKDAFDKMKKAEFDAEYTNRYEVDDVERIAGVEPSKTIEAQSGRYYDERNRRIVETIRKNENEEEREQDLKTVYSLHMLVAGHIGAIMDYSSRREDPTAYNSLRRMAHNRLISGLNEINHIAEKYNAERLVFRDFETNDFMYDKTRDRNGETNARAEYDRSIVESYVRMAFSSDFKSAERERNITESDSIVARFHGEDF